MYQLKELVNIVNKRTVKNLNVFTHVPKKGKLSELYEGVYTGRFNTDEEAMTTLYGDKKDSSVPYRKLKERLVSQLLNTVFFVSHTSSFTKHQQLQYECTKNAMAVKIVRGRSAYNTAETLAKKTLRLAMRLESTEVIVDMAYLLRGLESRKGGKKAFERYDKIWSEYNELLQAEHKAKRYIDHVTLLMGISSSANKVVPFLHKYEADLRQTKTKENSATFVAFSHLVFANRCEFENDQRGLQESCENAIAYLEAKEFVNGTFVFVFLFKSLDSYILFQQFEEGQKALRKCFEFVSSPSSINWSLVKLKYIRLALICFKINEGYEEYLTVISENVLKRLASADKESWEILKGYFRWFRNLGLLNKDLDTSPLDDFRPGKFVNMVTLQSKDKEGFNTSVVVLQLLFLVQMKKYGDLIDKEDAFKAYAYRYLRKRAMYRTYCFVKLMLLIPANQFNKTAVIRKSGKWLAGLEKRSLSETSFTMNMEIVSYEKLWEIVLGLLDNGFHKKKQRERVG